MNGTEITRFLDILLQNTICMLFSVGTGYFLETVWWYRTGILFAILDNINDSAHIMFTDVTVTGMV
jgi:hypothetical protein